MGTQHQSTIPLIISLILKQRSGRLAQFAFLISPDFHRLLNSFTGFTSNRLWCQLFHIALAFIHPSLIWDTHDFRFPLFSNSDKGISPLCVRSRYHSGEEISSI
eukprot:TRINITY_DN35802_c0_g1_i1.p1 TRINITY_DN35802_c0_g1~~TRINITY_DN35802_c0_g1_i1.p1  ORF type:complete len:104 (-),score=2.45 TRINITY_DN35802_c0_g1_i1:178-489(-)